MADPIHQFEIHNIVTLGHIGGHEIAFTNSALFMAITVVGIWALLMGGSSARALVPGRIQSIAELSYEFVANTIQSTAGKEGMILLDDYLFNLWVAQKLTYNDMMRVSQDPDQLEKKIREYTEKLKSGGGKK